MISKEYFTFDELLERWQCKKIDIHYLICNKDLVPSIVWNDFGVVYRWVTDFESDDNQRILKELSEQDYLSGWVYLRRPMVIGPSRYRFEMATNGSEDILNKPWYLLLRTVQDNRYPTSVLPHEIETSGVFMRDEVDRCEIKQPGLCEKVSESETENPQGKKQNSCHATESENTQAVVKASTPQPTELMKLVEEVQQRYWGSNWDRDDPINTKTSQEIIWAWLELTYGLSHAAAMAVEKVACPFDRKKTKRS